MIFGSDLVVAGYGNGAWGGVSSDCTHGSSALQRQDNLIPLGDI